MKMIIRSAFGLLLLSSYLLAYPPAPLPGDPKPPPRTQVIRVGR